MKTRPALMVLIGALVVGACSQSGPTAPLTNERGVSSAAAADDIVDVAVGAGFTTLVAAVQAAGLEEALRGTGPFTVFAPTDEAFAALPEGTLDFLLLPENVEVLADILLYHVAAGEFTAEDVLASDDLDMLQGDEIEIDVEDGMVFVNDAKITATDVFASNGVIHVIDAVLLPPTDDDADDDDEDDEDDDSADDNDDDADDPRPADDIVDVAVGAGFTTLVAAVQAAGLEEALRGTGPFTVFAPTDEAFAALPEGTLDFLLLPENVEMLADILLYHVAAGEFTAEDVLASDDLDMLQGDEIEIDVEDGMVFVNDAKITATDVFASNGVIHVIDAVLLPPTDDDDDDDDEDDDDENDDDEDDDDEGSSDGD